MWYTALLIGLTGSLHCAGMCSPLLMAVTNLTPQAALNRIVYNGGRVFTYGLLGALFSGAGSLLPLARYQNILSVGFGVALVLVAVLRIERFKIPGVTPATHALTTWIKSRFGFFLHRKNVVSMFSMGMLNGVLPCGMTLIAFSYCLLLSGPMDGFNFMLLFGVGTLPVMLGFAPLLLAGVKKLNLSLQRVTTGLMILSGVILVARIFLHAGLQASQGHGEMIDIVLCR
ncbi:sulfite exporter TauE/SafE family protein [Chryseolinea lacunae]|uniref:Sulfite exporter TauE/SafE family protein n=1 Tax=Chryseolinea lacunae TaxID=2801331 RepID=A0ABS1KMM6_9BACT|nr:sulfite exporter TauE/SafE family protein [Chryseolinea lacunae]MBL0740502.1 sulfite exporter TauE/SafE family protein [Chryseolinea lacunae]